MLVEVDSHSVVAEFWLLHWLLMEASILELVAAISDHSLLELCSLHLVVPLSSHSYDQDLGAGSHC